VLTLLSVLSHDNYLSMISVLCNDNYVHMNPQSDCTTPTKKQTKALRQGQRRADPVKRRLEQSSNTVQRRSARTFKLCKNMSCIASNINHHQPIRLDDGVTYFRNTPQVVLGRSEGHHCVICFEDFNIRDADLGTMDTEENCRHIFCHDCLLKHKIQRIKERRTLECPICRAVSVDITCHERRPSNEVEVITDESKGCWDWAMDTTSSTGIGNRHEERCICPLVHKKLRKCHHEGCNKTVHRHCQKDWLDRHCYPWTREDPHFCREHNEHYITW